MIPTAIKFWAEEDRPREKLVHKGRNAMSDVELLAILIGSGSKDLTAVELARSILNDAGNDLNKLGKKSISDLKKYKGIGEAKAVSIYASLELARRKQKVSSEKKHQILSSQQCYSYLYPKFADLDHEQFFTLFLNRKNVVIGMEQISKGGISSTVVDGKIVFRKALEVKCTAMIIAHNHPSGSVYPSESDKVLTRSLIKFGKMIDLPILDHLIITDNDYFSFADAGLIID